MISSIFILNSLGDVLFSRHSREAIDTGVCDYFWAQLQRETEKELPPVIITPKFYIIHSKHRGKSGLLYFLAVCEEEASPVEVVAFLRYIIDVFSDYFGQQFDETKLKEEFIKAYELLDVMLDDGKPFICEMTNLYELIPPPSLTARIAASRKSNAKKEIGGKNYTGVGSAIKTTGPLAISSDSFNQPQQSSTNTSYSLSNNPLPQLSNSETITSVPWRKSSTFHIKNNIYFDFVENMDVIIDSNGIPVISEVVGFLQVKSELSGMPEVHLKFVNPSLLNDVCLHRCVRTSFWEHGRTLDFIPPDGIFKLITYRVRSGVTPPLQCKHLFDLTETGGKLFISVGMKQIMQGAMYLPEKLILDIPLPKSTIGVNFVASVGSFSFDQQSKMIYWEIGKMPKDRTPTLEGTFTRQIEDGMAEKKKHSHFNPTIICHFSIPGYSASGARVDKIDVVEAKKYTAYKGVKSITHAGSYQIRT